MKVTENGKNYQEIKLTKEQVNGHGDVSAALKEINKMEDGGWGVFNTDMTQFGGNFNMLTYTFYLRRKRAN